VSYFDDNEDLIIYGFGQRVRSAPRRPRIEVTADDFDDLGPVEPAPTDTGIERELRLYKAAFERATQGGHEYQVEGWGGRWKTRRVEPKEWRRTLLEAAEKQLKDEDTSDLI